MKRIAAVRESVGVSRLGAARDLDGRAWRETMESHTNACHGMPSM